MKAGPQADKVYLMHMLECIERVQAYCGEGERSFRESRLIQDAVIRNLQTMAESSQRLTDSTKACLQQCPGERSPDFETSSSMTILEWMLTWSGSWWQTSYRR